MSFEKFITQVCSCDNCSETFDTDEKDFFAAIEAIKKEGWAVRQNDNEEWEHICPSCLEDESI